MSQICRQPLFGQHFLRLQVLTVLGVCVAECVLAVCVATVVVGMDLARIRSLVLFDAELMVCSGTTERETENKSLLSAFRPHYSKF